MDTYVSHTLSYASINLLIELSNITTKGVKLFVNYICRTSYLEAKGFCVTHDRSKISSVMHD